ncbi:hypothetical protein PG2022B_1866 [Bifidobacterium animalis subsp. animalis]|nr:hypothetical protein PG2022B_1866 [Bifidobacterium animalis subsp. animalis]
MAAFHDEGDDMLSQYVHALQGLLGPCLLVAGLDVLLGSAQRPSCRSLRLGDGIRRVGLLIGLVGAIAFAALRATATLDRRSTVNLPTLICCVVLDVALLSIVLGSAKLVRHADQHAGAIIGANIVAALALAATFFYATPDVILQLTNWVEPGDSAFTSQMLVRAIGFALGTGTAIAIAAIIRTLRQTAVRVTFTAAVALLVTVQFVRHGVDLIALLTNMRMMRLHGANFRGFIWVRNHALALIVAQALVFAIPIVSSVAAGMRTPASAQNPAQIRAGKAHRRRAWISAIAAALAIATAWVTLAWGNAKLAEVPQLSEPEQYSITNGTATITFAQVADGHLHRFEYHAKDGTAMRFIIVRKNGGAYGVGLDACETCGDAGYNEKDGKIICKRCDVAINLATIGFKGGCNPIPLPYRAGNGAITIATADLDALSSHFK